MKLRRLIIVPLLLLPLLLALSAFVSQAEPLPQADTSPTPTYDPLLEPPLSDHPTELELGRNLFWHWCMPCHGDRAQGLTDEFRMIWEPEHRDCWAPGCHAGRPGDGGFPIPTVVPALAGAGKLSQFASVEVLSDYLKATHPPQSPGVLADNEYHAIAAFVFELNGRPVDSPAALPVPTTTATAASQETAAKPAQPAQPPAPATPASPAALILLGAVFPLTVLFAFLLTRRK